MTWQTKDDFKLLPASVPSSTNGEAGSPQWVGDFRATWESDGGFTLFYGMNVIGGTSDVGDFLRRNGDDPRSEEHTSELQSLMRISYAVFCLKKKIQIKSLNELRQNRL